MKDKMKHILYLVMTMLLATACSQDALDDGQETSLPYGKYPLVLNAGGLQAVATPASRATVDGNWQDVNTTVAVEVDSKVKQYTVKASDADGYKTAMLTSSTDPFYWTSVTEMKKITAWWPYSNTYPEQLTVKANQSDANNFYASDLIQGKLTLAFADKDNPEKNSITFRHQTAKVSIQLIADAGVTFDEKTSVQLLNVSYVKDDDENNVTTINTYQLNDAAYTYLALLAPQTISGGSQFIQVTVGGDNFYYTPTDDKPLEAGTAYAYTITVKADGSGIEVTEVKEGEWTYGGEATVGSKTVLAKYTASDVKKGDYIYTDGTTSDGGLRTVYTDGSMKSLSGEDKPQPVDGKTVAGIVFWTPSETSTVGRLTPASLTDDRIMAAEHPSCTHGLAVAVKTVTYNGSETMKWQDPSEYIVNFQRSDFTHDRKSDFYEVHATDVTNNTSLINRILGYQNTVVLLAYNEYCKDKGKGDYVVHPAEALVEFRQNATPAPAGSTGWFLPSLKELHLLCYKDVDDIYNQNNRSYNYTRNLVNTSLSVAGGDNLRTDKWYWASTEFTGSYAWILTPYNARVDVVERDNFSPMVRAVCAF